MVECSRVTYSYVLLKLIRVHFVSSLITSIAFSFSLGLFSFDEYSFIHFISVFLYSVVLISGVFIPASYVMAFPAFILGIFFCVMLMRSQTKSYLVWVPGSVVIGCFYFLYFEPSFLIASFPVSVANGIFMCHVARRSYVQYDA